jgi:hypothetical protein
MPDDARALGRRIEMANTAELVQAICELDTSKYRVFCDAKERDRLGGNLLGWI